MMKYMRVLALVVVLMGVMSAVTYGAEPAMGIFVQKYSGKHFSLASTSPGSLEGDYFTIEIESDGQQGNVDEVRWAFHSVRDFLGLSGPGGAIKVRVNGELSREGISLSSIPPQTGVRKSIGKIKVQSSKSGNKYQVELYTVRALGGDGKLPAIYITAHVKRLWW